MPASHQRPVPRVAGKPLPAAARAAALAAPDRADLAAYIGNLATELANLARTADLRALYYLLDMVRLEAEQQHAFLEARRAPESESQGGDQASDTRPAASR
ncbi:MAG: hypothetical protein JNK84_12715 [Phreatobacter sp.]|uniref:hypothetical protein n=1 Tax=Phreatobacter sp. TaxID=1966341 RepID=UPI001A62F29B|nr:hypothetical protein [Phreatobacter sp.]MBL8569926.1 hypothetical protein [Phreatobacter sp.]